MNLHLTISQDHNQLVVIPLAPEKLGDLAEFVAAHAHPDCPWAKEAVEATLKFIEECQAT